MLVKQNRDNYWMLNWLDQFMIGHKGFICGGCFKNIFMKQPVKDLDIFFKCEADFKEAVDYFDSQTAGYIDYNGDKLSEDLAEYMFLYENKNVKAYIHKKTKVRIELCSKIYGTPEEILNEFDFTIVKFAYIKEEVENVSGADIDSEFREEEFDISDLETHIEYKILMHDKFFEHLHLNRLVIDDKIPFPMSTLERAFRYAKYGYSPCKETKVKLAKALKDLPEQAIEAADSLYDGMD